MKAMTVSTAFLAATLALITFDAGACGESMFHSGQAMRYHAFISRQPANILVYRPDTTDSSVDQKRIFAGLEKAGHKVTVVRTNQALARALADRQYDVIIAGARDMSAISALLGKEQHEPALLAVLTSGPADESLRQRYPDNLRDSDGLNQYLKTIEHTMQTRKT
ncbi:MAG: hypothetical protein ABI304_03795 [Rudaea sp.]